MATDTDDALTLMMCDTIDEAVKEIARIKREARGDMQPRLHEIPGTKICSKDGKNDK